MSLLSWFVLEYRFLSSCISYRRKRVLCVILSYAMYTQCKSPLQHDEYVGKQQERNQFTVVLDSGDANP